MPLRTLTLSLTAALAAGLALTSGAARAADFGGYGYGDAPPPPYAFERRLPPPVPVYGFAPPPPRFVEAPPPCRVIVRRRYDPFGDEVVRRVEVCGPPASYAAYGPPRPPFAPPPWRYRPW